MVNLSLNDFKDQLVEQQQLALNQMKATTGEEFSAHLAKFQLCCDALNAIYALNKPQQKEPEAQVDSAQDATTSVAKKVMVLLTVEAQRDWLKDKQSSILFWMNNSTGEAFKKSRDELIALSNAIQLTRQFEKEVRG